MENIVFTGPAFDLNGQAIPRANLVAACQMTGRFNVQSTVNGATDFLVASRTDTTKAKKAAQRGVTVVTYPEFISRALAGISLKTRPDLTPCKASRNPRIGYPDYTLGLSPDDLL